MTSVCYTRWGECNNWFMLKDVLMTLDTSKCLELWSCVLGKQHLDRTLFLFLKRVKRPISGETFLTHCRPLSMSFLALVLPALYILQHALVVIRRTQTVLRNHQLLCRVILDTTVVRYLIKS